MNDISFEEDLRFRSQPFGICSHAQYFPEYVAKVLIYEIEQSSKIVWNICYCQMRRFYVALDRSFDLATNRYWIYLSISYPYCRHWTKSSYKRVYSSTITGRLWFEPFWKNEMYINCVRVCSPFRSKESQ